MNIYELYELTEDEIKVVEGEWEKGQLLYNLKILIKKMRFIWKRHQKAN